MKNFNLNKKAIVTILAGGIILTTMTGCNKTIFDTKQTFNKAIIFGEGTATIINISKWSDYEGEQIQIITNDGMAIVTSSFDTKLINDKDSDLTAEDLAYAIGGKDVEIAYLDEMTSENQKQK